MAIIHTYRPSADPKWAYDIIAAGLIVNHCQTRDVAEEFCRSMSEWENFGNYKHEADQMDYVRRLADGIRAGKPEHAS